MSELNQESSGLSPDRQAALLRAALELAGEHDLDQILDRIVDLAAEVADARYAALGVYESGHIERFIHRGIDPVTVELIGSRPAGRGLLGEALVENGPVRLKDLRADPQSCGFPPHHPPMTTFLGVPLRRGPRRLGNLYLTEKRGGAYFDAEDERVVVALAAFAAAAIEAATLVSAEERAHSNRELLRRVIEAQEAERARLSRDLHDQIGQSLTSVLLGQRLVLDSLDRGGEHVSEAHKRAYEVRTLVTNALAEVRQLAFELRPIVLDDLGLVAAVHRLAEDLAKQRHFRLDLDLSGLDDQVRLPGEIETAVYRIVQEALTNVARHAQATTVRVGIGVEDGHLRAEIVDDGVGFESSKGHEGSLGFVGMIERAELAGGTVELISAPGVGTTVLLDVPVE